MIDLSPPSALSLEFKNLHEERNVKIIKDKLKTIFKNPDYVNYLELLFSITVYIPIPHKSFVIFSEFQYEKSSDYLFRRFLYYSLTHQHRLAKKYYSALTEDYYTILKVLSNNRVKDFFFEQISNQKIKLLPKEKLFYDILKLTPIITDYSSVRFQKWKGAKTEGVAFPVYKLEASKRYLDFSSIKIFKKVDGKYSSNFTHKILTAYLKKRFSLAMNVFFVFLLDTRNDPNILTPLFFSFRRDDFELFIKGEGEYGQRIVLPNMSFPEGILVEDLDSELVYTPEELFSTSSDYLFGVLCYNKQGIYKIYPNSEVIFQPPYKIKDGHAYWKYKHFSGKRLIPKHLKGKELKIRIVVYHINEEAVYAKSTNIVEDISECAICSQNEHNSVYKICMNCCKSLQRIFKGELEAKQDFFPALPDGSYHIYCTPIKKHLKLSVYGEYIEVTQSSEEDIEILPTLTAPTVVS